MPVTPPTQEAKIRRIAIHVQHWQKLVRLHLSKQGMIVHTSDPSDARGIDRRIAGWPQTKKERPYLKSN
jgi:hypothetical protein